MSYLINNCYRIIIAITVSFTMLLGIVSYTGCVLPKLKPVSYADFELFVIETDYITDAEKYGWSIVQVNVFDFETVDGADWRKPDGINVPSFKELPVTQVSYNDAIAYCEWSGTNLPTYNQYWNLVKDDDRVIVSDNLMPISDVDDVNIIGNVWDLTLSEDDDAVRLAGGSLFCAEKTCNGTVKDRELYVDRETGNLHIGFSVF